MPKSFCLIQTKPGKESHVYKEIAKIPSVGEVYALFGEYDILAEIITEKPGSDEVAKIVTGKIRKVKGIVDTVTYTGIKF